MAEKPEKFSYGNHGPWRVPIPEEAKKALTTNLPFLTENLELSETFWSHLLGCGFTIYDRQDIERGYTNDKQRVVALLEKVKIRSKGHLISFLQALAESGQASVLQKLGLGYEEETRASKNKVFLVNCTSCNKNIKEAFSLHDCGHMVCSECAESDQIICQIPTCQAQRKVKAADPEMTEVIRSLSDSGRFNKDLLKCDQCKRSHFVEHLLHKCTKCSELLCAKCLKQHTQLQDHQVDHFHQTAACCIHGRPTMAYCRTCRLYVCTTCLLDGCKEHDTTEDKRTTRQEDCVNELTKVLDVSKETATSQMSLLKEYPVLVEQLNKNVEDYTSSLRRWKNTASQLSDDLQGTLRPLDYPDFVQKLGGLSPQLQDMRTTQQGDCFSDLIKDLELTKERSTLQISLLEDYPTLVEQLNKEVEDYTFSLRRWTNMSGQLSDDLRGTLPPMDYADFVQKLGVLCPQLPVQVREFFSSHGRDLGTVSFDLVDLMVKMYKPPTTGQLLGKFPASRDTSTSGYIWDVAWDQRGDLLVGQHSPHRLDRIVMDAESHQLRSTRNICKDQPGEVSGVSVNEDGDIGAVIRNKGVRFNTCSTGQSTLWEPSPSIPYLRCIVMYKQTFCICSENKQSTVYVYNTNNKTLVKSIPLNNNGDVYNMVPVDNNTLVISERDTGSLYLVNIETERVTKVTPKYPDGENVLSDPYGVSCDPHGRIYVCDYSQKKVVILSREGEYLTTLGGDLEGGLRSPDALAVRCTPGHCTLAVSDNKEVKIYALSLK